MCMSCGCGEPNEAHGNNDNITMSTVERAATAAGISTDEVMTNLKTASAA